MKKIISIILILCLCLMPVQTQAKSVTSGTDGNGNKWTYNTSTKTLTFTGNKAISDFTLNGHDREPSWYRWSNKTEHIVIEEGITGIGSEVFSSFTETKSITMGESVKRINRMAFWANVSLREIKLSSNITVIQGDALSGGRELETIKLPMRLRKMCSLSGQEKLEKIVMPDSITNMQSAMFSECKKLKYIKLPAKIRKIKSYDFAGCKKLKKLTIPKSVKTVSMSAFAGSGLKKIVLPENVTTIKNGDAGRRDFQYIKGIGYPTKNLRVIKIHSKKVKSIQKNSFSGLSSKVVIKVPKSKKKKYTKMLRKSGLSKKVKICINDEVKTPW